MQIAPFFPTKTPFSFFLSLSSFLSFFLSLSPFLSVSLSLSLSFFIFLYLSVSISFFYLSLSLSLSLSHTHTHTLSLSLLSISLSSTIATILNEECHFKSQHKVLFTNPSWCNKISKNFRHMVTVRHTNQTFLKCDVIRAIIDETFAHQSK